MKNSLLKILLFIVLIFLSNHAIAFIPEEHLSGLEEKRARTLFMEVKCPVCAGQVIESSDSEVSRELRKLIRTKIAEGNSNAEIKSYLINKFGDDIIISPSVSLSTIFLWILPLIFAALGVMMILKFTRLSSTRY